MKPCYYDMLCFLNYYKAWKNGWREQQDEWLSELHSHGLDVRKFMAEGVLWIMIEPKTANEEEA